MAREERHQTYGKGSSRDRAYWQRILKSAVALKLINIDFKIFKFNNVPRVCRRYQLNHDEGGGFSLPNIVNVPDQDENGEVCANEYDNIPSNKPRKRKGRGKHYLPIIKDLLKTTESWNDIKNKEDYTLPGFSSLQVSYCSDWKSLPLASSNDSFIVKDCQLSVGPTHSVKQELSVSGVVTKVTVRRGQCEGVKFCSGDGCAEKYIVSRSQKLNRCPEHSKAKVPLSESGPCPVNIAYVTPDDTTDRRRWIISLSLNGNGHNHGIPSPHTIPTRVKEDIKVAVEADPSRTAADLQKGKPDV